MAAANDEERDKGTGKKKKAKSTPKKERQISLRLSPRGAKRLSQLTDKTEWSVTQVIEEALKVYAAQEDIHVEDKVDDRAEDKIDDKVDTKTARAVEAA